MPFKAIPSKPAQVTGDVTQHRIAIISDLDKLSKGIDEEGHAIWKSLIMNGTLTYDAVKGSVSVTMSGEEKATILKSSFSRGSRGMELSELATFNGKLYSVDDRTGIVFDVSESKAVPWVILADGDGNSDEGFKGEWMARKDGLLYVGSHGKEFVKGGKLLHSRQMWIKKITKDGAVEHVDWKENYKAMSSALECPFPGYVIHEAGVWSDVHRQWFFLPRKLSKKEYDPDTDYNQCSNILLRCSEDFKQISKQTIGELKPTHGFSSFKFIPGTKDTVIAAVKSEEKGDLQKSFLTVFTIDGKILLEDMYFDDAKFEGLEFI